MIDNTISNTHPSEILLLPGLPSARIGSSPSIPTGFLPSGRQKGTPKLPLGTEHNSNFVRLSCLWAVKNEDIMGKIIF